MTKDTLPQAILDAHKDDPEYLDYLRTKYKSYLEMSEAEKKEFREEFDRIVSGAKNVNRNGQTRLK